MLCLGFSLCYVQSSVCLMCRLQSVLCAVFSLSYVQSSVCLMCSLQSRTSSLRSEHASLRSVGKGPTRAQGKGPGWAQGKGPTRAQGQKLRPSPPPLRQQTCLYGPPGPLWAGPLWTGPSWAGPLWAGPLWAGPLWAPLGPYGVKYVTYPIPYLYILVLYMYSVCG